MSKKKMFLFILPLLAVLALSLGYLQNDSRQGLSHMFLKDTVSSDDSLPQAPLEAVNVEQFGAVGTDLKDDSAAIQQAIDYSYDKGISKVILSGNKHFVIKKGIIIKRGVELYFDQNTKLYVQGNFRAIELLKNASITNGIIEVTGSSFNSEVIYLNGQERFWSWERTQVNNVSIINSTPSHKGTGLSLYANGPGHFICFVNFSDLRIVGFRTGIKLESVKPESGYSFINGNRFINITLDDCLKFIEMKSSVTVPHEATGNQFLGLQIQPSSATQKILTITGSDNMFEGMIWDLPDQHNPDLVLFTKNSYGNQLYSNVLSSSISDQGKNNYHSSPVEESKK
ncbi:glycoside hydrolase family 55 protein [Halobacillus salinarum]|uniref:Glycoside hydrolase family 55 protein n=1 Tax=Halobacillus salinarum TaxID=2932257 RepID=A0ABY4ELT3_9BACI|nr:glycoside hydrolase family 55 protein [Halobacillus salinarum]UOQ45411.1 glycoside hydrolase family 55 protein [Halobacillus salinarum]